MNRRRLAALVRVRSVQETVARAELARQRHRLAAAERDERHVWASIEEVGTSWSSGRSSEGLVARDAVVGQGVLSAESAAATTVVCAAGVDAAQRSWNDAARREEALERLLDRVIVDEDAELARFAANELDDLVAAAHVRSSRHAGPASASGPVVS